MACRTRSSSTFRLLNCSRCVTTFLRPPQPAPGQPRPPSPGQSPTLPNPQSTSFFHTPSPWSCSTSSRTPAHLLTCGCCDADPRHLSFGQLQPLGPQPALSSPGHKLTQRPCHQRGGNGEANGLQTAGLQVLPEVPGGTEPKRGDGRLEGCPPGGHLQAKGPDQRGKGRQGVADPGNYGPPEAPPPTRGPGQEEPRRKGPQEKQGEGGPEGQRVRGLTQRRGCGGLPHPPANQTARTPHPGEGGTGTHQAHQRGSSHASLPKAAPHVPGQDRVPGQLPAGPLKPTKATQEEVAKPREGQPPRLAAITAGLVRVRKGLCLIWACTFKYILLVPVSATSTCLCHEAEGT